MSETTIKQKKCTICGQVKYLPYFGNDVREKDEHKKECKVCYNERMRAYNKTPLQNAKKRKRDAEYRKENRYILGKKRNEWNKKTGYRKKESQVETRRQYRLRPYVREKENAYAKEYWKKKHALDILLNPPPPPKTIEEKESYLKYKGLKTRLILQVKKGLRRQDATKKYKTIELIGCSYTYLMKYLESKFEEGMTWGNRGYYGWHIDHIMPLDSFDLNNNEQQRKAFHYTNLQPLWWRDNLLKSNKILVA